MSTETYRSVDNQQDIDLIIDLLERILAQLERIGDKLNE